MEKMEKAAEKAADEAAEKMQDKVEDGAKAVLWEIYGPHPGLALLRFWQGIVELCIAIAVIALSIALLVSACVAISDVSIDTTGTSRSVVDMVEDSRSATGFLIFISLLVLLWELGLILVRLLNFGIVNRTFLVFGIVVIVVVVVEAVCSFSGGVAAAVEGEGWREQIETWEDQGAVIYSRGQRIPRNLAATAAFGILAALGLTMQGVWTLLFLVFGWNKNISTPTVFSGVVKGVGKEAL